ncbi:hypothetical protein [Nonomuraea sp. NPDC049480]|uniref:hypothetical protein n=1 Tax=Nonomuraea sp. NPDC049480 TaxID=3364353 RepID=UPI0037926261
MSLRSRLFMTIGVLALTLNGVAGAPVFADGDSDGSRAGRERGGIGIRLLEATLGRKADPRAHIYIVDHVSPGTRFSRRLEIRNTSREPQHVRISTGAAEIRDGTFVPSVNPHANELSSWISVDRPSIVVPPNSSVPFKATIRVPESATKGERYGAIWAEVSSGTPGAGEPVRLVHRIGVRVYLDIGPGGDPPSDFVIEQLTPGRTDDGKPVVKASVRNTGERALDLSGKLRLSEGPGGLNAGPFPAQTGTTVAINGSAPVMVVLDARLPDGPWQVELTLQSGLILRTVTGTLTFPAKSASWGLPALLDSPVSLIFITASAIAVGTGVILLVVVMRQVRRRRLHARKASATP